MSDSDLNELSREQLLAERTRLTRELKQRARDNLASALTLYVDALGAEEGCEQLVDDLFRVLAPKAYPAGWNGLLQYAIKASG